MKTVSVVEYFEEMGYDWKSDRDSIEHILELTKTRPKNNPPEKYVPSAGVDVDLDLRGAKRRRLTLPP